MPVCFPSGKYWMPKPSETKCTAVLKMTLGCGVYLCLYLYLSRVLDILILCLIRLPSLPINFDKVLAVVMQKSFKSFSGLSFPQASHGSCDGRRGNKKKRDLLLILGLQSWMKQRPQSLSLPSYHVWTPR